MAPFLCSKLLAGDAYRHDLSPHPVGVRGEAQTPQAITPGRVSVVAPPAIRYLP
ncbi:hypothetical protein [Franconibacter daqui]|uniref:Uncharacterized protein n=1 Tax=Franconibacter daqui TaxID=2047724 RepID=A0ABV1PRG9_9ENTR